MFFNAMLLPKIFSSSPLGPSRPEIEIDFAELESGLSLFSYTVISNSQTPPLVNVDEIVLKWEIKNKDSSFDMVLETDPTTYTGSPNTNFVLNTNSQVNGTAISGELNLSITPNQIFIGGPSGTFAGEPNLPPFPQAGDGLVITFTITKNGEPYFSKTYSNAFMEIDFVTVDFVSSITFASSDVFRGSFSTSAFPLIPGTTQFTATLQATSRTVTNFNLQMTIIASVNNLGNIGGLLTYPSILNCESTMSALVSGTFNPILTINLLQGTFLPPFCSIPSILNDVTGTLEVKQGKAC